ncbi:MAG: DUF4347 domain-containing protein, partial [Planctomycetota bacterium]
MAFRILALEERIVLDAAVDTDDATEPQELIDGTDPLDGDAADPADGDGDADALADGPADADGADAEPARVLVVNAMVQDADLLAEAAARGVEVVSYSSAETTAADLLARIRDRVGDRTVESLGLVSHDLGTGRFQLARDADVSLGGVLASSAQQDFWREVGGLMAADGRIDLFACDLAGTDEGGLLVAQLEYLTGADVAASTDPTGNADAGGDWVLEDGNVDLGDAWFGGAAPDAFRGVLAAGDPVAINLYADTHNNIALPLTVPSGAADAAGTDVAMYDDIAVVGAPGEDAAANDAGAVYVYRRDTGGSWNLETTITADDAAAGDAFGTSVSAYHDRIVIGAPGADASGTDSGAAYVFGYYNSAWTQNAKVTASDADANHSFGTALDTDGDWVMVGDDNEAVYAFRLSNAQWTQAQKLTASDGGVGSGDGY